MPINEETLGEIRIEQTQPTATNPNVEAERNVNVGENFDIIPDIVKESEDKIFQDSKYHNTILISRENIVAIGKSKKLISPNSYLQTINDKFRRESKRYWKKDDNFDYIKFAPQRERFSPNKKFNIESIGVVNNQKTRIIITAKRNMFIGFNNAFDNNIWEEYVQDMLNIGTKYDDYTFFLKMPFPKETLSKSSFKGVAKTFGITPTYNFYNKNSEEASIIVNETLHPNLYFFASEIERNKRIHDLVEVGTQAIESVKHWFDNTVSENVQRGNALLNNFSNDSIRKSPEIQLTDTRYFDVWANNIFNVGLEDEHYRKLGFINTQLLNKYYDKKSIFPMNIEISLTSDGFLQFTDIFDKSDYIRKFINVVDYERNIEDEKIFIETIETQAILEESLQQRLASSEPQSTSISSWDVLEIFNNPNNVSGLSNEAITFLENDNLTSELVDVVQEMHNRLQFKTRFNKILNRYWRRYWELIEGNQCYGEVVFYKIAKIDSLTGNIIQEFYIPNTEIAGEELRYVDCQVKYGKEYLYEIYAYCIIIGLEYSYQNLVIDDTKAIFDVIENPSVKLFEIPYVQKDNVFVVDSHPMAPNISFKQYTGIRDKILIMLNSSAGQDEAPFIKINDDDIIEDGAITKFKKDDYPSYFEVYRTDIEPTQYSDFSTANMLTIDSNGSDNGAFIDIIEPEKYYYYIARTVDIHQKVSNPTIIYKVIMLEGENNNYIEVEKFDFKIDEIKYNKNLRRFLFVRPSLEQRIMDESNLKKFESAKDVQEIKLGQSNDQQWGRTFKLRMKSRKTGKTIDLNFSFDYSFVKNQNNNTI